MQCCCLRLIWPSYCNVLISFRFLSLLINFYLHMFSTTQVRIPDYITRSGVKATQSPVQKWPSLCSVLSVLLGCLGQSGSAVPAVSVPVWWISDHGGPPSQRPVSRPGCLCHWPHSPQLPLLSFQCCGLHLCIYVLFLLGQRRLLHFPLVLCGLGNFFYTGFFLCLPVATPPFSKWNPTKTRRGTNTKRVIISFCYLFI